MISTRWTAALGAALLICASAQQAQAQSCEEPEGLDLPFTTCGLVDSVASTELQARTAATMQAAWTGLATSTEPLTADQQDLFEVYDALILSGSSDFTGPDPFGRDTSMGDAEVTDSELRMLMDGVAQRQVSSVGRTASEIGSVAAAVVGDRLVSLRAGVSPVQISSDLVHPDGVVFADPASPRGAGAAGDEEGGFPDGLGIFLNTRGGFGDRNGNTEELGFDFHQLGATLGVDYRFGDVFVAGIAGGYTYGAKRFNQNGGNIRTNTGTVSLYAGLQGDGLFADFLYSYSYHDLRTRRGIVLPTPGMMGAAAGIRNRRADGNTEADEHLFAVGVGHDIAWKGLTVTPSVRFEYIDLEVDGFTEFGAGGLSLDYNSDAMQSLISNFGIDVAYAISTPLGVVTPQVAISWAHQYLDDPRAITARPIGDPVGANSIVVRSQRPDRNYVDLGASLATQLSGGFSAFFAYDTILAHDDIDSHQFTLGGRYQF